MADKVKELEERLDKLENRLKVTFLEVEKRFESFKEEQPVTIEDRLQELEDLLLLIQLEVTKLKDRSGPLEFSVGAAAPDINERLNKLEEAVLGEHVTGAPEVHVETDAALEHRMRELEERVQQYGHEPVMEEQKDLSSKLDEIEKRLARIESKKIVSEKGVMISSRDVLDDVKKILYA
jgi:DNA repair exonuclease SbcCD ATPase subunit